MRVQSSLAENVVIIEPGSLYLRIGRAVETIPKCFLHCIARKPKSHIIPNVEPLITRSKPELNNSPLNESLESLMPTITKLFHISNSIETPQNLNVLLKDINSTEIKNRALFEWETNTHQDQEFFALNDSFEYGLKAGYHISWPMRYGFFSTSVNYTSILQDLEDIWSVAIEKHVGIPKANLNSYRAILIINDVYKRSEIRHLTNLLLNRLKFGRVFVHQASVCTTYGLGLPTACVINIGAQKTSVCCVEDGIAHTDTRVILPVGKSDILRMFHSMLFPNGIYEQNNYIGDFSYQCLSDMEDLRTVLENASQEVQNLLCHDVTIYNNNSKESVQDVQNDSYFISTPFLWIRGGRRCENLSMSPSLILLSHILPFGKIESTTHNDIIHNSCTFQLNSVQSSEPDDPFDDLYVSLTARERRKRGFGQSSVPNEQVTNGSSAQLNEQDTDAIEQPPALNGSSTFQALPNSFNSLCDAVWWSITQCSNIVAAQTVSDNVTALAPPTLGPNALNEDMRRRLLGCIILVGGGVSGASSYFMDKWLTEELTQLVECKLSGNGTNGQTPAVEIITQTDPSNLTWCGARLLLTTDLLNDIWLTQNEWVRFGSRALREKAPFLW